MFKLEIKEFNVKAPVFVPKEISNYPKYEHLKNIDIDILVNNVNKLIDEITELYVDHQLFDKLELEFIEKNPWIFE